MAKKVKPQTTTSQGESGSGSNNVTVTIPSGTLTKNITILFIRGAMMRIPFLLFGCLVLWALKEYGFLPSSSSSTESSATTGAEGPVSEEQKPWIDFSVMQVFAVNVFSEACVKVWMRLLGEGEKGKGMEERSKKVV